MENFPNSTVLALPTRKGGQFHLKRSQKYLIRISKEKQTALPKEITFMKTQI